MLLSSPVLVALSLLAALLALASSFLHKDLIHLPDHTGRASFRTREEILSLPVMDGRDLPVPFSSAAVLLDIEIHNREEHALAMCSELTRSQQSSQLKQFQRLRPCGNDKKKQLTFATHEETPQVWSRADTLDTSSVHFLTSQQLKDQLTIVRLTAENHNSLHSASFTYSITASVVGPKNPLYWFHWLNQEAQSQMSTSPVEKHMWNLLDITRQQTKSILTYCGYLKKYLPNRMPNLSKHMRTIKKVLHPSSCRSVEALPAVSTLKKSCLRFSLNLALDDFLAQVLPREDFCHSFCSGGAVVGVLVVCNLLGYFYLRTDHMATTIIQLYSFKRLFFSMFVHFDLLHLLFNLRMLVLTGSRLTALLNCDHVVFLWFYLVSGLGGGVFSLLWRRARGSCSYSAGASGALYGLHVALAMLAQAESKRKIMGGVFDLPEVLLGSVTGDTGSSGAADAMQLVLHIISMDVIRAVLTGGRHIDSAAHVGGALTGLVLATWYLA